MSSHLPYSSYISRTSGSGSKYGTSSYLRTSSAPSSNTNSLERTSRTSSYGTSPSRSSTYSRFGSASSRSYTTEPERARSPERRVPGLRMGSSSRFGAQIARSPISEKSPTVFGVAPKEEERLQLVTRATSPTPPSSSTFVREKRASQDKTLVEFVPAPSFRPVCASAECQTELVKEESPPPPAVQESPRFAAPPRWSSSRPLAPRYSTAGGYSYRREPDKPSTTTRYGGLGFKPEPKTPSPTRDTKPEPAKSHIPSRVDPLSTVNKDFRKSVLNMGSDNQNTNKSRPSLNLPLNKSLTTTTVGQVNGRPPPKKKEDSSSSSEDSSSEEGSSSDESVEPAKVLPAKPPASPKSVVVKTLPPVAGPMKVQYPQESSGEESKKSYQLRRFDSGVNEWWQDGQGDASVKPAELAKTKSKLNVVNESEDGKTGFKLRKFDSGERAWWNESNKNIPESLSKASSSPSQSESDSKVKGLKRTPSKVGLQKVGSHSSLASKGSDSDSKSLGVSGLYKTPSKSELSVTHSSSETDSKSKLHRSASQKSVPGKPPSPPVRRSGEPQQYPPAAEMVRRSDVLEPPTEFTPGLLRLHTERWSRPLVRVESGQRDWWLDEAQDKSVKPVGGFVGPFNDIDLYLGTAPPPPAAFLSSTSDQDSDSSDDGWYKKGCFKNQKNGTISGGKRVDDSALQLYKDGDYGNYLDLEASINEQQEEFESFNSNQKNSIVLRTQLSVRVHTIIDKLLKSEGRELRRALFSLKQIFQEDKDLVHEFVQNEGLSTLIKVGASADQNNQNYILRALGQVMLYVDGMNGVINHPGTIQWLYDLVSSKSRLVVKTALKLLLVFVEYTETNCVLFVKAIRAVDYVRTTKPWSNIMKLIKECDACDTELLIYAMTLINKTLNGLPDQDTYYDQVDAIEEQGMEGIIRKYIAKQGADLDLLRQFQIYEAVLRHEDGDDIKGSPLRQLDESIRKSILNRKSLSGSLNNHMERRKSRRYSTGNSPLSLTLTPTRLISADALGDENLNGCDENSLTGVTPGLRRRRERAERQKSFIREQREATLKAQLSSSDMSSEDVPPPPRPRPQQRSLPPVNNHSVPGLENGDGRYENGDDDLCRDGKVKDLSQKLANSIHSPTEESKYQFSDMKGIISKAKEELAKSQSRGDILKSPSSEIPSPLRGGLPAVVEVKKSETELHWEEMARKCSRSLKLCDLDFTDLGSDEERDVLAPAGGGGGIPPPPPPVGGPPPVLAPPPPAIVDNNNKNNLSLKKTKKTVKLFWKEVRDDPIVISKVGPGQLLWDEISPVAIDIQKLEHLFESRAKDLITKKQQEMNKNKEIIILDHKRSNAINIGMTKLPPPRSIKTAILKMDATVMNREGIEKLLTMLPTEEERTKIQEAQAANPDLPLGSAEQFLLTLASISELPARLKLWAFKLDYENSEKEIAERLMDLKQGMETLKANKTFRAILGTLLSIGIFLNGSEVKGFQIEYLSKVPEVKDTVHKHTLLHHLCHMVMEKFPESTDLYSEIGAVTRASKVDFEELATNIQKMEQECKASFDHLKAIAKHDGATNMKLKLSDFLADSAERIIVLGTVHRRVIHRFQKFCLWLGIPIHRAALTKPNELCQIISEFALEYRTTRERVLQQLEKKANHRERNKTRGKMITEVGKFKTQEDRADAELKQLLDNKGTPDKDKQSLHGSLPWRRTRKLPEQVLSHDLTGHTNGHLSDADDEILETLVKTATRSPVSRSTTPRERKRARNADLIKRSRTRDNVPLGEVLNGES